MCVCVCVCVCLCVCVSISNSAHCVTNTTNRLNAVQENNLHYVVYRCHSSYGTNHRGNHENFGPKTLSYIKKVNYSHYRPGVAQRVGRGIALLVHDRGTRSGSVVSSTPRPHFTPGKDLVPILQDARWAPRPVWTGRKSRHHRDSIPDRPARSPVAIPTELPGPRSKHKCNTINHYQLPEFCN